jgi:hypothetical protein
MSNPTIHPSQIFKAENVLATHRALTHRKNQIMQYDFFKFEDDLSLELKLINNTIADIESKYPKAVL